MASPPSPSPVAVNNRRMLVDLVCAICTGKGSGVLLGVISCRACAAFFKRSILLNKKYKCYCSKLSNNNTYKKWSSHIYCRACRLKKCQEEGMKMNNAANDEKNKMLNKVNENPNNVHHSNFLGNFTKNYQEMFVKRDELIEMQNVLFTNCDVVYTKISAEIRIKLFFHLSENFDLFDKFADEKKVSLINCFKLQFLTLHQIHLTLVNFPDERDTRIALSPEYYFDCKNNLIALEEFLKIVNRFRSLNQLPIEDICALMILALINEVEKMDIEEEEFVDYRESLLNEWTEDMTRRLAIPRAVALRLSQLLSLLTQIKEILNGKSDSNLFVQANAGWQNNQPTVADQHNQIMVFETKEIEVHQKFSQLMWVEHEYSQISDSQNLIFPDNFYNNLFNSSSLGELLQKIKHWNFPKKPSGIINQGQTHSQINNTRWKDAYSNFLNSIENDGNSESLGSFYCFIISALARTSTLYIALVQTMPFFNMLDIADRVALLKYILVPLMYTGYFYTNGDSVLASGKSIFSLYCETTYSDQKVMRLADLIFVKMLHRVLEINLIADEFVLLRAILIAQPTATGLSLRGQELLRRESEHYASILLRQMQRRLGHLKGASRYAEALQIIQVVFKLADKHGQLLNYMDIFHMKGRIYKSFPRPLSLTLIN